MRSAILHGAAALATFALALTNAPDAGAAIVLTTGIAPAFNSQTPACYIINIDTKPITVTAQLIDGSTGMPTPPAANFCPVPPATVAPGTGCSVLGAPDSQVYCVVTTSSAKVRASLDLFNGFNSSLEVQFPATR